MLRRLAADARRHGRSLIVDSFSQSAAELEQPAETLLRFTCGPADRADEQPPRRVPG